MKAAVFFEFWKPGDFVKMPETKLSDAFLQPGNCWTLKMHANRDPQTFHFCVSRRRIFQFTVGCKSSVALQVAKLPWSGCPWSLALFSEQFYFIYCYFSLNMYHLLVASFKNNFKWLLHIVLALYWRDILRKQHVHCTLS